MVGDQPTTSDMHQHKRKKPDSRAYPVHSSIYATVCKRSDNREIKQVRSFRGWGCRERLTTKGHEGHFWIDRNLYCLNLYGGSGHTALGVSETAELCG